MQGHQSHRIASLKQQKVTQKGFKDQSHVFVRNRAATFVNPTLIVDINVWSRSFKCPTSAPANQIYVRPPTNVVALIRGGLAAARGMTG